MLKNGYKKNKHKGDFKEDEDNIFVELISERQKEARSELSEFHFKLIILCEQAKVARERSTISSRGLVVGYNPMPVSRTVRNSEERRVIKYIAIRQKLTADIPEYKQAIKHVQVIMKRLNKKFDGLYYDLYELGCDVKTLKTRHNCSGQELKEKMESMRSLEKRVVSVLSEKYVQLLGDIK